MKPLAVMHVSSRAISSRAFRPAGGRTWFARRWPVWLLLPALALVLAACQGDRRSELEEGPNARPVATVNNERIPLSEFQTAYQSALQNWERFVFNDESKREALAEAVLQQMIEQKLLDQEVRRKGLELDEQEFRERVQAVTAPLVSDDSEEGPNRRKIQEWMADMKRRVLREKLVMQEVRDKIRISRRTMREYYDQHIDEFVRQEEVRVRHIAVGNRDVYNRVWRLLDRDVKFERLVEEFSITPDRADGGDLGYVTRGILPPEFDEAIFALQRVGTISPRTPPVHTQIGYHIFRLEGRREAGQMNFEQALPLIRRKLLDERQHEAYVTWLRELKRQATIRINRNLLRLETG